MAHLNASREIEEVESLPLAASEREPTLVALTGHCEGAAHNGSVSAASLIGAASLNGAGPAASLNGAAPAASLNGAVAGVVDRNGQQNPVTELRGQQAYTISAPVPAANEGIRLPGWFGRLPAPSAGKLSIRQSVTMAVDLSAIVLGILVALRGQLPINAPTAVLLLAAYPIAVVWLLRRPRTVWDDGSTIDELRHIVGAASLPVLAGLGANAVLSDQADVQLGMRIWVCTMALLVIGRIAIRYACASNPLAASRPLLIVGAGKVGAELARRLRQAPQLGLRPVGFLDYTFAPPSGEHEAIPRSLPVLGTPQTLPEALSRTGAKCVAFAFTSDTDERLLPLVEQCEQLGVSAFFVPRLYEAAGWRMQVRPVGALPLVELRSLDPRDIRFSIKHALDRVAAAALLFGLSPLLAVIAVTIKLTSPGPVFFRQRRIGRDGREFTMLKFRTMRVPETDLPELVLPVGIAPGGVEGGDRRTPVGIWLRRGSLDELPQLLNVLRGEMSMIGPRPERPQYVRRFAAELRRYDRRHRVKSGITGLAQTSGLRGQTSIVERAEYDNFYVQNWSFWLDLKIALRTVKTVFSFKGE